MIRRIRFGMPFPTEAVYDDSNVVDCTVADIDKYALGFMVSEDGKEITIPLASDDVIYGLGETLHGMNKRGFTYISFNADEPHHNEDKYSLYGAHNFFCLDRCYGEKMGIFVDYPGKVIFDMGDSDKDFIKITLGDPVYPEEELQGKTVNYDLYVVNQMKVTEVLTEFRALIGPSYKAPEWAFGFGQSRWGYMSEDDIREVVRGYKEAGMPLSMVYMDIDYMDDYKVFTLNEENYPNFKDFVQEMKDQGIHLLPNVDPAVKIEKGFALYEEGLQKDYYCKDEKGEVYPVAVWPGLSALPDFMKPDVKTWFGEQYKLFTEAGVEGFWNDMNEPAIFYSPKTLKNALDKVSEVQKKQDRLKLSELWDMLGTMDGMANNMEDYQSFYHETSMGKIRHDRVHNLYGYHMMKAGHEALKKQVAEGESLIFSRSSYIGSHRYGGIWTGDNCSFYSHIELLMHQLPGLNMCGFLYVGADTAGFGFNTNEDLAMRFLQLSIFTPLCRNHSSIGTKEQEFYKFKNKEAFRKMLILRYALNRYLYKSYLQSIEKNTLMFTPLGIAYPDDPETRHIEDQLMVGEEVMIAPVCQANVTGRHVYLPEKMRMFRTRGVGDYDTEIVEKGHHYIRVNIDEVLVFLIES